QSRAAPRAGARTGLREHGQPAGRRCHQPLRADLRPPGQRHRRPDLSPYRAARRGRRAGEGGSTGDAAQRRPRDFEAASRRGRVKREAEPVKIVDTHLHLVYKDRFSYPWLEGADALNRQWPAEDYFAIAEKLGIESALHMEVDV